MMKMASKFALVAAVAALAIAGSTADSLAKGKKTAAAAACAPWSVKVAACNGGACTMQRCWADGKWHPSLAMCWQPFCPK